MLGQFFAFLLSAQTIFSHSKLAQTLHLSKTAMDSLIQHQKATQQNNNNNQPITKQIPSFRYNYRAAHASAALQAAIIEFTVSVQQL